MSDFINARMYQTHIDVSEATRGQLIALLNQELANLFDLYSQTKQAHWNVKGMQFIALHELFDELAETLEDYVDMVAERITALGGIAMGTARMSAAASRLPEYPTEFGSSRAYVEALVEVYAQVAASARAAIYTTDMLEDKDTSDLFTELSRGMDKHLWFLEAHLQI
ncbi:MAG: DNA starvation/stationary phase protection protein Dps [Anaerolineae bacterium]